MITPGKSIKLKFREAEYKIRANIQQSEVKVVDRYRTFTVARQFWTHTKFPVHSTYYPMRNRNWCLRMDNENWTSSAHSLQFRS